MTPVTSPPNRIGNANPACKPTWAANGARGKFGSFVTSVIQAGFPLAQTRPGSPTPGRKVVSLVTAVNSVALNVRACHKSKQDSTLAFRSTVQIAPTSHPRLSQIV